jgi:hypothetical protein
MKIDTRELMNYRTPTRTANELKKSKARIRDLIRTNKLQAIETPLGFLIDPSSIERFRLETEQD